jgi:hypothetical protein
MLWQPMPEAFAPVGAAVVNMILESAVEAATPFCKSVGTIAE